MSDHAGLSENQIRRTMRMPPKRQVFTLKSTLTLELDFEFALRVAECIATSGTVDKQIIELGRQLKRLEDTE